MSPDLDVVHNILYVFIVYVVYFLKIIMWIDCCFMGCVLCVTLGTSRL